MCNRKYILVINGASSSELAPNYIALVQKQDEIYSLLIEQKTNLKGGPERFPIYFQSFIQKNIITVNQIGLIAVMVGPGSFTGLRASIAFALGLQVGLNCPVIALRRGEALFPFLPLENAHSLVLHVTQARRGRFFVENNQSSQITAYNEDEITFPSGHFWIVGEVLSNLSGKIPEHAKVFQEFHEANAVMMAKIADQHHMENKKTNMLYPLYVDPPEAKLPQKGLRKAPV